MSSMSGYESILRNLELYLFADDRIAVANYLADIEKQLNSYKLREERECQWYESYSKQRMEDFERDRCDD